MKKIFLTGSSGFFGQNFNKISKKKFVIFNNINVEQSIFLENIIKINLLKRKEITQCLKKISPDIILHAAAITDVDYCEKNKNKALKTNFQITKNLVDIASKKNLFFVFISSDQLYDGSKKIYNERSKYSPCNYYALTKVKSEIYIRKKLNKYLIIRTNFFGKAPLNRKSFSDFVIQNIKSKKKISLFDDVIFNPLHIKTLIENINKLILLGKKGIYNISSDKPISKYDLGRKIINYLKLNKNYLLKSKIENFSRFVAKRPKYMFLDNRKIKKNLNIQKLDINSDIKKLFLK